MACFRNICGWMWSVYYGDPVEPPAEPTYCYQWAEFDAVYTSEINGVDVTALSIDQVYAAIVSGYDDYQGVIGTRAGMQYISDNQTWYIQVFRPYGTPPFANLGTYVDSFDPGDPITYDIEPTNVDCVAPTTYQAVFSPNNPALTDFGSEITINGRGWDGTPAGQCHQPFDVITSNDFFSVLNNQQGNVFEPDAGFSISINGNQVTFELTTILEPQSWAWGNSLNAPACLNPGGDTGNFNFTAI